jgi:hypothetical protein
MEAKRRLRSRRRENRGDFTGVDTIQTNSIRKVVNQ